MIDQLFGSKTRVKLLRLFHGNPNRSFYVREITRKIDEQINSVRRELSNLLSIGIITSDEANNKLYYEVNKKYEYYVPLTEIFGSKTSKKNVAEQKGPELDVLKNEVGAAPVSKTMSTQQPEASKWQQVGNVTAVIYSGIYTRDDTANVDIIVIGDVLISKVESLVADLEKEKKRELRYAVIEKDEWEYRRQVRDKFYTQIMSAKNQIIIDKENYFA